MFGFDAEKEIKAALENNTRKRVFHKVDDMNKVLILFTYQDWGEIYEVSQYFKKKGKRVIFWTIEPKKIEDPLSLPSNVRVVSQKEISRWQGLSRHVVEEFKDLIYDTLMDFTTNDDDSMYYLLANNSSQFCIGIKETQFRFYDFVVLKEQNDLKETFNQIKFYLDSMGGGNTQ